MRIEMHDSEGTIMREIADKRIKRNDIALTYWFLIRQCPDADYGTINRAIIKRWSIAGLKYIKERAWKIVEGKA